MVDRERNITGLALLRQEVGRRLGIPPRRVIEGIMRDAFYPTERDLFDNVLTQDLVRPQLVDLQRIEYTDKGLRASRPVLCADYIRTWLFLNVEEFFEDYLQKGNRSLFALWFDVASGLAQVSSRVYLAEAGVAGQADEWVASAVATTEEDVARLTPEGVQSPDLFGFQIGAYKEGMADAETAKTLLIQDPTGFLLIDDSVKQIKGEFEKARKDAQKSRSLAQIDTFTIAGAEMAAKVYKKIYPWTENLPYRMM